MIFSGTELTLQGGPDLFALFLYPAALQLFPPVNIDSVHNLCRTCCNFLQTSDLSISSQRRLSPVILCAESLPPSITPPWFPLHPPHIGGRGVGWGGGSWHLSSSWIYFDSQASFICHHLPTKWIPTAIQPCITAVMSTPPPPHPPLSCSSVPNLNYIQYEGRARRERRRSGFKCALMVGRGSCCLSAGLSGWDKETVIDALARLPDGSAEFPHALIMTHDGNPCHPAMIGNEDGWRLRWEVILSSNRLRALMWWRRGTWAAWSRSAALLRAGRPTLTSWFFKTMCSKKHIFKKLFHLKQQTLLAPRCVVLHWSPWY